MTRPLLAAVFFTASALAQTPPANMQIIGDRNSLISGETLQLTVVFRDAAGKVVPGGPLQWSSLSPPVGSVDANGVVKAGALGIVKIKATLSGLEDNYSIQVVPRAVRVTPQTVTLRVGQTQQFSAAALDMNGAVIPNTPFTWKTYNAEFTGGPADGLAPVSAAGLLTARSAGRVSVRAEFAYPIAQVLQNQTFMVYGSADLRILAARTYSLSQINLPSQTATRTMRIKGGTPSLLYANAAGQLAFYGVLDGLANGILLWDAGNAQMIVPAGVAGAVPGTVVGAYSIFNMNASGDLLIQEEVNSRAAAISMMSAGSLRYLAGTGAPIGTGQFASNPWLSPGSLSDSGWMAIGFNFNTTPTPSVFIDGLFRGSGGSLPELVVSTFDPLPGLSSPFVFGSRVYGIDGEGTVYFAANAGTDAGFYRVTVGGRPVRVIGTGDPLLGSTVKRLYTGNNNNPVLRVANNGDVFLAVLLDDNRSVLMRLPKGDVGAAQTVVYFGSNASWSAHSEYGLLLHANVQTGNGAYRFSQGKLDPLLIYGRSQVDGSLVQDVYSCAFHPDGTPVCLVRTLASSLVAVRLDPTPTILFQEGDSVTVTAPLNVTTQVGGARSGPPEFITGGVSGSVVRLAEDGSLSPVVTLGDALPNGLPFTGTVVNRGQWGAQRSVDGTLNVVYNGVFRATPGGIEMAVPAQVPLDGGEQVVPVNIFRMNEAGDFLYNAYSRTLTGNGLFITTAAGKHTEVFRTDTSPSPTSIPGFGTASGNGSYAMDNRRRVMANLFFTDGRAATSVWDGGVWTVAVAPNVTVMSGQKVPFTPNILRAWGDHLLALLFLERTAMIAEWTDSGWKTVWDFSVPLPNGQLLQSPASFEVNTRGDIVMTTNDFDEAVVVVRLNSGEQRIVYSLIDVQAGDPRLFALSDVDIRDDGTVYLYAQNANDERVLYVGKPVGIQ